MSQQYRPFAFHQLAVDGRRWPFGALEIGVHVGGDLAVGQAALDAAAHRVRPVLAEGGEALDLAFMHMGGRVQDARADAVLVERTVAQLVERGARPPAFQQAQRIEAVGDQRDQPGLRCRPSVSASPVLPLAACTVCASVAERHVMAADKTLRDDRAQERAGIVGRDCDRRVVPWQHCRCGRLSWS